jgi:hypothetical protein
MVKFGIMGELALLIIGRGLKITGAQDFVRDEWTPRVECAALGRLWSGVVCLDSQLEDGLLAKYPAVEILASRGPVLCATTSRPTGLPFRASWFTQLDASSRFYRRSFAELDSVDFAYSTDSVSLSLEGIRRDLGPSTSVIVLSQAASDHDQPCSALSPAPHVFVAEFAATGSDLELVPWTFRWNEVGEWCCYPAELELDGARPASPSEISNDGETNVHQLVVTTDGANSIVGEKDQASGIARENPDPEFEDPALKSDPLHTWLTALEQTEDPSVVDLVRRSLEQSLDNWKQDKHC